MRLILDRIAKNQEGERIATFECGEVSYYISEENMPVGCLDSLKSGMIIEAEVVENSLINPEILYEETEKKQKEMKNRLNNLFNRNR